MDLTMVIWQILIMWGLTTVASFIMEIAQESRLFKELADLGYKLNFVRFREFQQSIGYKNNSLSWMLVPLYNIFMVIENTIKYNEARNMILDELNVIDVIEEMSDWELNEYKKNPIGLNAILLPIKYQIELDKSINIKLEDGSKIYYVCNDNKLDDENISILKVEGPASILNIVEQKKLIIEHWAEVTDLIKVNLENLDNIMKNMVNDNENNTFNIKEKSEENEKLSLISSLKQELENLKKNFVSDTVEEKNDYQKINKKK